MNLFIYLNASKRFPTLAELAELMAIFSRREGRDTKDSSERPCNRGGELGISLCRGRQVVTCRLGLMTGRDPGSV